ncbi:hypothetical protein BXQ27_29825 [Klebsiella aerogenes]|nr:hypothetical protein BXQ27_29825 [Klebsiella aerogenes]
MATIKDVARLAGVSVVTD